MQKLCTHFPWQRWWRLWFPPEAWGRILAECWTKSADYHKQRTAARTRTTSECSWCQGPSFYLSLIGTRSRCRPGIEKRFFGIPAARSSHRILSSWIPVCHWLPLRARSSWKPWAPTEFGPWFRGTSSRSPTPEWAANSSAYWFGCLVRTSSWTFWSWIRWCFWHSSWCFEWAVRGRTRIN